MSAVNAAGCCGPAAQITARVQQLPLQQGGPVGTTPAAVAEQMRVVAFGVRQQSSARAAAPDVESEAGIAANLRMSSATFLDELASKLQQYATYADPDDLSRLSAVATSVGQGNPADAGEAADVVRKLQFRAGELSAPAYDIAGSLASFGISRRASILANLEAQAAELRRTGLPNNVPASDALFADGARAKDLVALGKRTLDRYGRFITPPYAELVRNAIASGDSTQVEAALRRIQNDFRYS